MVGVTGFEPVTPRPPGVCATGLRHTPTDSNWMAKASQHRGDPEFDHDRFID